MPLLRAMDRYRAALTHFALSMLVVGGVFVVVYFVWYPEPLFRGAGGRDLFLMLAFVDVTIGPLVTLLVFKPGKWGLKFDLAVIAILQVAALAYGTHVVFEARPAWIVFLKDRFDLVRANQLFEEEREKWRPPFDREPLAGPRIVGARIPKDPDEQFRTMITALSGADVSSYPQHYVPYEDVRAEAVARARKVAELRALNPGRAAEVSRALASLGREEEEVAFLPMRAGKRDLTVLIDARSGEVLGITDFRPWNH
jgi:hypothetical protein